MYHLTTDNMRAGYVNLVKAVRHSNNWVKPRDQRTLELSDVIITLTDPSRSIPYEVGRKLHLPIASAEFIQLVGGYSDVHQLASIAPVFTKFTNLGRLRGAYGPRLYPQWPRLIRRLVEDPDTRQAVATIWRADELHYEDSHDVPCTISLSYTIRDGALDARTHMRSNDLWLGLPYDFGQFTALQRTLAWALGVNVGTYTHFVNSLHLYERNLEAAANVKLIQTDDTHQDRMPPLAIETSEPMTELMRWALAQSLARRAGMGIDSESERTVHSRRLDGHASILPICHICRYAYDPDPKTTFHNICDECTF